MTSFKRIALRVGLVSLLAAAMGTCLPMNALADDIGGSFSITNRNPNGAWTYGSLSGSTLTPFTVSSSGVGSGYWTTGSGYPVVVGNNTGATVFYSTWAGPTDTLILHPDPTGIASDVRWTAPSAGMYSIAGLFEGVDYVGPTTTDVHILLNGSSLFGGNISSYLVPSTFSLLESLNAGDTIDFAVGFGLDGNYFFDSTGLAGSITQVSSSAVPEPVTLVLLGTGLAAIGLQRKRKPGLMSR
jgi:PEP-CTERM motif-containing protein